MFKKKINCPNCGKEILVKSKKETVICDYCTMSFLPKDFLKKKKFTLRTFFKILFIISLFYYVYWICVSIGYAYNGISEEKTALHMESFCDHDHEMIYGYDAFHEGLAIGFIYTLFCFWYIPLYQFIYILICIYKYNRKIKQGG